MSAEGDAVPRADERERLEAAYFRGWQDSREGLQYRNPYRAALAQPADTEGA